MTGYEWRTHHQTIQLPVTGKPSQNARHRNWVTFLLVLVCPEEAFPPRPSSEMERKFTRSTYTEKRSLGHTWRLNTNEDIISIKESLIITLFPLITSWTSFTVAVSWGHETKMLLRKYGVQNPHHLSTEILFLSFPQVYCLRDSRTRVCEAIGRGAYSHQQLALWSDRVGCKVEKAYSKNHEQSNLVVLITNLTYVGTRAKHALVDLSREVPWKLGRA